MKYILVIIFCAILLFALYLLISKKVFVKKPKYTYKTKKCLMTNTELKYYSTIKSILKCTPYILQPQVCLSSIVERVEIHKYQSELSRVADFVVFSPEFTPLLVIEVNDTSHKLKSRKIRDSKVRYILKSSKLKLVELKTTDKFDIYSIAKELKENGLKIDLGAIYNEI